MNPEKSEDGNMELFTLDLVIRLPKVVWQLCYIHSHMNSARNTRKCIAVCGDGPKNEPGRPQVSLVFLGDQTVHCVEFQLVEKHFLLFVRLLIYASVHGEEMSRVSAIMKIEGM